MIRNADKIPKDKCDYYAGRAEELMPNIVKEYSGKGFRLIGIVDPPRSGLHRELLKALRTCKGLEDWSMFHVTRRVKCVTCNF